MSLGAKPGRHHMPNITPSLWFNGNLEDAATFYASVFPNSSVEEFARYTEAGPGTPGAVVSGTFVLDGTTFIGINGGPEFPFSEAVSFVIDCADQAEVDYYWDRLVAGAKSLSAAGSRTGSGSVGKWFPGGSTNCSATPNQPARPLPPRRCSVCAGS
jgi:predicted 3-demethylubiquinone-9 3-methyltransferase (glyoxalase superfamily)